MSRKKLLEGIKANPMKIYRTPDDVLRDRRFDAQERVDILTAWQRLAPDQPEVVPALAAAIEKLPENHAGPAEAVAQFRDDRHISCERFEQPLGPGPVRR